ncbi:MULTISPECIES: helix-turn-helix transcriptional regulator [Gordonia]|uniref:helix-turn-helix transcriptional regulator n=1 Tax=Gordonia TaxID=2053 RepID=UPI0030FDFBEF
MTVSEPDASFSEANRLHRMSAGHRLTSIPTGLPRTERVVGLLGATPLDAVGLDSWLAAMGYRSRVVTGTELRSDPKPPAVVITRDPSALDAGMARHLRHVRFIVVTDRAVAGYPPSVRIVADSNSAPGDVEGLVGAVLGRAPRRAPVRLTDRERDVMTTYVMGATVSETASKHFIAEATVRTHYQRVTRRYEEAGRAAANKSQLLVRMVADGWIELM